MSLGIGSATVAHNRARVEACREWLVLGDRGVERDGERDLERGVLADQLRLRDLVEATLAERRRDDLRPPQPVDHHAVRRLRPHTPLLLNTGPGANRTGGPGVGDYAQISCGDATDHVEPSTDKCTDTAADLDARVVGLAGRRGISS
ncbi:MAG: hypothetical protein IPK80_28665 [Nannocystis sp.]|nr:hypothetical protein [Nannocystis sp.]